MCASARCVLVVCTKAVFFYIDLAFGNNGASTCLNRLGNKWMSICNVAIATERDKYIAFFDVCRMGCNALDIGIISAHPHDIWYVG